MKFGVTLFQTDVNLYPVIGKKAEEVGIESMWMSDHLAPLTTIAPTYPYSSTGMPPFKPDSPWLDSFVTMSSVAAVTERIKFANNVYILPLRHPFVTARAVATLDLVSKGRVLFGVGVGWWREEFEAAGQDFDNRGPRSTEIVEILRRLWTEDTIEHRGAHYSFGPMKFEPKPVQRPIPIMFGGTTKAALRRAAREGDGWVATAMTPEQIREAVGQLKELRESYGRAHLPFRGHDRLDAAAHAGCGACV